MIYIDTGAFLGRYLRRDENHSRAVSGWRRLRKRRERGVTSNFVLDETFTLLGRWAGVCICSSAGASHLRVRSCRHPAP